jgi:hypothetical protein
MDQQHVFCCFLRFWTSKKFFKIFSSRVVEFFGLDQVCMPLFDKKTLENKRKNQKK